ncbi:tyrosine-type recombinase/integrase [Halobacterium salinarum]|uniref:tyrosine-type recombinase/integrase n=1 Tax=Halobacterium salinarum TaxID=2242 RepID=UPI001F39EE65|nr:site-specific integrase [Halobacterium salinarum]MCF2165423.1 site-specific integrase [Halobacterium salinarum]MCF2168331.1 site-specific integrase [Halobacterium salinarum]
MPETNAIPRVDGLETALDARLNSITSPKYRQDTKTVINNFAVFLVDERGQDVDALEDITVTDCRRWVQYLRDNSKNDLSAASMHTYYAIARSTIGWFVRDRRLDTNPMDAASVEEELPHDDGNTNTQFWDDDARDELLAFVDERAHDALEREDADAAKPFRERALVYLLADTGVRGAEILSVSGDNRRNGIRWADVDLDAGVLDVLGKSGDIEPVSMPGPTVAKLDRYYRLVEPPAEWPVIPTGHAPSKFRAVRDELIDERGRDADVIEDLLAEKDVDVVLREEEVAPPALTTEGARTVLKRLCDAAGVDVDGEYLKPHGGRRALGDALYRESPTTAQDALRHQSIETTHESYRDVGTEQLAEDIETIRYNEESE